MKRKDYEKPTMQVIKLQQSEQLLNSSPNVLGGGTLGRGWSNSDGNAWGGSSSSGGGSGLGGWTDNGGNAWE